MAEEKKDSKSKVIIILLIIVIILLIGGGVTVFFLLNQGQGSDSPAPVTGTVSNNAVTTTAANKNPLVLDYDDAAVALDENGLERQIEEMKNAAGDISLEYKNEAESDDGTNFICYLANSDLNTEDMFIAIFKDASLTDQVYLSGLLKPGTSIQNFVSEISFEPGTYSVVALFTSVGDDHETMTSQIAVELKLTVN